MQQRTTLDVAEDYLCPDPNPPMMTTSANNAPTTAGATAPLEAAAVSDSTPKSSRGAQLRRVAFRLAAGQAASLATASTGIFTTILVNHDASVAPMQSLLAYIAIALIFLPLHAWRGHSRGHGSCSRTASMPWWRMFQPRYFAAWMYVVVALFDFGANFLAVWAYSYTDIISAQLLDCFTVPCVVVFAYAVFRRKPRVVQVFGAIAAVLGLGLLVLLDSMHQGSSASAPNPLLGDLIVLAGSVCYAISNTACEALLKSEGPEASVSSTTAAGAAANDESMRVMVPRDDVGGYDDVNRADNNNSITALVALPPAHDDADDVASSKYIKPRLAAASKVDLVIEYLAFLPLFGAGFAAVATAAVPNDARHAFDAMHEPAVAFAQIGFALVMVVVYTAMPALFALSSATFANLSLLSADVYAIILYYLCFGQSPQPFFVIPFVVIVGGLILYEGVIDWQRVALRCCGRAPTS